MSIEERTRGAVRAELARQQITSRRLAELTGVAPSYWSRRLRGDRQFSLADLEKVAELTGVTVGQLVAA